jgi:hypothetical protein
MKQILPVLLLLAGGFTANAQFFTIPDTILIQKFLVDPSDTMLDFPSGNDLHWVNWDADNIPTLCGDVAPVPQNWFWENDLGDDADPPVNFAFTSCSFLVDSEQPNENWLITPPVFIADSTAMLSWRSSPFEGPAYMDGYKVLISTGTNEPFLGVFTDTVFVAAEMLDILKNNSLDPDDYLFSPGYVHADRYTNPDYFFLIHPTAKAYTGRLEPHAVSLAKYAGKTIYIAFLHDSMDDSILQLDDITVVQDKSTGTTAPGLKNFQVRVQPNPTSDFATISWELSSAKQGQLIVTDMLGKTVLEQKLGDLSAGTVRLDVRLLLPGAYSCTLRTMQGQQSVVLVKW